MTKDRETDQGRGDGSGAHEGLPEARRHTTRWPGWVWLIPLGAVLLVGWFVYQGWIVGSHEVVVRFDDAGGVSRGAPVTYKGVQVGHVDEIGLAEDLEQVELRLVLTDPLGGRLGERTQFWIERPRLAAGDLRGLMSGPHLAVRPGEGPAATVFQGLADPPPAPAGEPGRSILLTAPDASGLSAGASVTFRGVEVGRVAGVELAESARQVRIRAVVKAQHTGLVREGSVFWRAGGVSLSTRGGFDVDLPSPRMLLSGAVAFVTPEHFAGEAVGDGAEFALHAGRDAAEAAAKGTRLAYFVRFPRAVSGLSRGDPVELDGARVGRIAHVGLEVGAEGASFATPMEIELDANAFGIDLETVETRAALRERLDETLAALVRQGLRAKIASGGFLPGGKSVTLVMVDGAAPASLDSAHEPPAIPAVQPEED